MRIVARTSRVAGVGSSTPERSSSSADPMTAACSRTSSSARWNPNASACQRRCWSSPYASRSAPAAASERWMTPEVVPEGVRVGVSAVRLAPGRRQAVRGQRQHPSVRRVGQPALELSGDHRKDVRGSREPLEQLLGRRCVPLGGGQGPGDAPRLRLETEQDVLRRDLDRAPGHVRGHVRVAVPVAADPRPPSEERPVERRRSRPGTGRQRAIHLAGHDGQHVEDRLVEQRHLGAHLVQRLRTTGADLAGAPQRRHLLHQASIDVQSLARGQLRVVEPFHQRADPPQGLDDRAPPRLGRMRREDGHDLEPPQQRRETLVAERVAGVRHAGGERIPDRLHRGVAAAEDAQPVVLLREVDQLEVAGERPSHLFGAFRCEAVDDLGDARSSIRRRVPAERDRGPAQALDVRQQLRTVRLLEDATEDRREETDLPAERRRDRCRG